MLNKIKSLNKFNCIKFINDEHQYLINGKSAAGSVTKIISNCKPPFDTTKWSKFKADQRKVSQETILNEWSLNSKFSTQLGTLLHNYVENYWFNRIEKYNQKDIINTFGAAEHSRMRTILGSLIKSFHGLHKELSHLVPVRTELIVGDVDDARICGSIDLLAFNTEIDAYEIYDYKTNKKFTNNNKYNERYTNPEISHLDVCDLNSYSLQQSFYKYFIEKYTDIKIQNCNLIWFDRDNLSCEKIPCKDLTQYCKGILETTTL